MKVYKRQQNEFFVIAHNIRSLFNVGAIFRTADAFAVSKIFLTGYTPTLDNVKHKIKINKTALGAEEFVLWEYNNSAIKAIKNLRLKYKKLKVVALENNLGPGFKMSTKLNRFKCADPIALVLGEEVGGVDKKILKSCDKIVEIPMYGKKESLNVSVAFGVAAYVISQNLKNVLK
ncbi:MAG: TrmH family RNA methyltransferase [Candidatus Doudnabacteria bacterium]|nr:TrmH family RNA methyltransferase [Candidatus Doudnabacteria bacterium]